MATWQFDIALLPEAAVRRACGTVPVRLTHEQVSALDGTWFLDAPPGLVDDLQGIGARRLSWSPSVAAYGDEKGSTVEVGTSASGINDVSIRIDARHPDAAVLEGVVRIASRLGCVAVGEDGTVIPLSVPSLAAAVAASAAGRFVRDPSGFLNALGEGPGAHHDPSVRQGG